MHSTPDLQISVLCCHSFSIAVSDQWTHLNASEVILVVAVLGSNNNERARSMPGITGATYAAWIYKQISNTSPSAMCGGTCS